MALANEIAKSPLFAERILNEVNQAEERHQQSLLEQAKEILKTPSHRNTIKEQAQEKIGSNQQKTEVKQQDRQEQ